MKWAFKSLLLEMTVVFPLAVDEKLTWTRHVLELKNPFAEKLGLLKKARFLLSGIRQDLYFRVILPPVTYGLILWGCCCNSDFFQSLEGLHCRVARLTSYFPKDVTSAEVLQLAWPNGQPSLFIINLLFLFVFIKLSLIAYLSN